MRRAAPRHSEVVRALGRRLRDARERRLLSVPELAARLGVSRFMLHSIEQGRAGTSVGWLVEIADALDVSLDWLLGRVS